MTCYESIVLFMNKWIGILARCANKLLHHDDSVPKNVVRIFSWWSFLFSKGGKTMNDNMVHITIDGKKYTAEPGSTILGVINENGLNIRKFVTCQK